MDPVTVVGLAASIVQLIDATNKVVDYVNNIREASKEQEELVKEAKLMLFLLIRLKDKTERNETSQSWLSCVPWLGSPHGPLDLLKMAMEEMASKLKREKGVKRIGRNLGWLHTKEQINRLLSQMERTKTLINLALADELLTISKDMKAETALMKDDLISLRESISRIEYSSRREIADWISPASVDYATQQGDIISRRQEGTGSWLLDSPEFATWLESRSSTLFCPGIPGAGKSMMTAIAIEHLWMKFPVEDDPTNSTGICFVFCNFKRREEQGIIHIIAALLKQLVQEQSAIPEAVENLYQRHCFRKSKPSLEELYQTLCLVAINHTRVFVVIDALDECISADGTRKKLLDMIFELQKVADVKFLATSRFIHAIEEKFEGFPTLEIKASNADLHAYLMGQMSLLPRCVSKSHELQKTITSKITEAADGMFLLAQLHMESLKDKVNPKIIKNALSKLSKGSEALDIAYKDAIERIDTQAAGLRDIAQQVISWIVCAKRRLTTGELREALAIEPGSKCLDEENFTDIEDMVNSCAGLVTVDGESHIIRLVHYTTEEYFQNRIGDWLPTAPSCISMACLTYLSFNAFATGACSTEAEFQARITNYVFFDYASKYWGAHLHIGSGNDINDLALQFLFEDLLIQSTLQVLFDSGYRYNINNQEFPMNFTGLHLAAFLGLDEILAMLLESCEVPDPKDSNGRTPLSYAAGEGHEAVVKLLLARSDIDFNTSNSFCWTPLLYAAREGHEAVVKLLLTRSNININASNIRGRTPLSYTAAAGHEAVVKLLLARSDIDVNTGKYSRTPLSYAAEEGHEAVVKLLLAQSDIDVNASNIRGRTPLSYAAARGHEAVVKLLLVRSDININARDGDGWTSLLYAVVRGHETVVNLLLAGSDIGINVSDKNGLTPLLYAAERGQETLVKLLLAQSNIDVNMSDMDGRTPLSYTAARGHEAVVKLLLARSDININICNMYRQTPLSYAAENGQETVVKLLLARSDIDKQMLLSYAAENGQETVVKLLLAQSDIDVNTSNRDGRTPLSYAAARGHEAVVKLLLAYSDININARDEDGWTPLLYAVVRGHETVVNLLLARSDIGINVSDKNGLTPLLYAAERGQKAEVKLLLACSDIDVNVSNRFGQTPLSCAAERGHETVVKLLLAHTDIDANTSDKDGQTPLSYAAGRGHEKVVKPLLARSGIDVNVSDM